MTNEFENEESLKETGERRAATQRAARQSGQPLQTARRNQHDVEPRDLRHADGRLPSVQDGPRRRPGLSAPPTRQPN